MAQNRPIPPLTQPVIDEGQFFSPEDAQRIGTEIRAMYDAQGPQMVVWTMADLGGEDIESLGIRAADTWKVGRAKKDDGLILLLSKMEHRMRLEVGHGLEGVIPDILANRILMTNLRPAMRNGNPAAGVISAIHRIEELTGTAAASVSQESAPDTGDGGTGVSPLLILILFILLTAGLPLLARLGLLGFLLGGGGGWRGGGGGGNDGGWSGGGGGFSGGGSSGDW